MITLLKSWSFPFHPSQPTNNFFSCSLNNMETVIAFSTSFVPRPHIPGQLPQCAPRSVLNCSAAMKKKKVVAPINRRKNGRLQDRAPPDSLKISDVRKGDELIGTVRNVGPANSAWIDIGVATSAGRLVPARLRLPVVKGKPVITEKEGSIIPVYVWKVSPQSGRIEVRKGLKPPEKPSIDPESVRMMDSLQTGEEVQGKVVALGKYGAVVDINVYRIARRGKVVMFPGLLSRDHFRPTWGSPLDLIQRAKVDKTVHIGDELSLFVRAVYPQSMRLFFDANEVSLERLEKERKEKSARKRDYLRRRKVDTITVGDIKIGTVRETAPFGVFIELGLKRDGLLHFSEMGQEYSKIWMDVIPVGTEVEVKVTKIDGDRLGVGLISVLSYELNKAVERAALSTVTPEDAATVESLTKKLRAYREERQSRSLMINGPALKKVEANVEDDDDEQVDDSEEDEDEDIEQFSDEYFEARYGL